MKHVAEPYELESSQSLYEADADAHPCCYLHVATGRRWNDWHNDNDEQAVVGEDLTTAALKYLLREMQIDS